ncbi:Rpn family recombination-promoting nuclease/putative transposase [Laspinema olomoucense]|uniref:Rpn family recombination-promoting nuclease/putative transposase n=1 Tax=Laspinema olomoucense D3b TaxID=2953688 RepID=A0ABT2N6X5_9CYAN|nr:MULTISPECIES: Rpn family recombination-promoting nuclease/putative transposase [unclassified Laspinema]MCT7978458.1 Rpn family recombination-promoting nuclease/putative transposase [Laspinema sp. D3b]MCT7991093.1 Rpn family recombination-promoting nuclease/putative transposase [Laspinema sp. D3a]
MNTPNANYDQPWKEALDEYLEPFLAFFFPEVHQVVDWSRGYESLDKELQQITPTGSSGEREGDKLFKVWQKNGEEAYILIHIEVQSQEDSEFPERMYIYHYRSFDIHKKVISLAILGCDRPSWRPHSYSYNLAGCSVTFEFPTAKLLDYESQWETLETSLNPLAFLVMAHLKTQASTGKAEEREQYKWELVQNLYERGYTETDIINLFRLLDWMMTLPESLQQSFDTKLKNYQEERKMPILSNIERRAMEAGRKEGRQEGHQEGSLENARSAVLLVLSARFNSVSPELSARVNQIADILMLSQLLQQASVISSVAEFEALIPSDEPG